jgi:hypothetical protein
MGLCRAPEEVGKPFAPKSHNGEIPSCSGTQPRPHGAWCSPAPADHRGAGRAMDGTPWRSVGQTEAVWQRLWPVRSGDSGLVDRVVRHASASVCSNHATRCDPWHQATLVPWVLTQGEHTREQDTSVHRVRVAERTGRYGR